MNQPDEPKTKPAAPPENDVPDGAAEEEPKGRPTSDRHETETSAS